MSNQEALANAVKQLQPLVKRATTIRAKPYRYFSFCLRAALAKSYGCTSHAFAKRQEGFSSFSISTLRGICEELIYLSFISTLSKEERETLIRSLMITNVDDAIKIQSEFFQRFRPYQPVINRPMSHARRQAEEDKVRDIWKSNGWSRLERKLCPDTRQIAEHVGNGALAILYDYIFRLTSSSVHFQPRTLLRSGWGNREWTFSPSNMAPYFQAYSQLYGALMLCIYLESFGVWLRLGADAQPAIRELRQAIIMFDRWPEMLTFEEMGMDLPDRHALSILLKAEQAAGANESLLKDIAKPLPRYKRRR